MDFLLGLHSGVRWIIVAVTFVAAIWFLLAWAGRVSNPRTDRLMMLAFTIGLDIQVIVGIIYLIATVINSKFEGIMVIHAAVMLLAVGLAHMVSVRWQNAESKARARNYLLGILAALLLVVIGVSLLPEGIALWRFGS